jgi:ubiquinone/menaquinone biosynthesis C-methylase UbiE
MDHHYTDLANAFDLIAPGYDAVYGPAANHVMSHLREENLALLMTTFSPDSLLLEIGCGTGEEAIALARKGYSVLATDIAPAMVAITQKKAATAGLSSLITTMAKPAAQLRGAAAAATFDGAFASFGSLNCEPDLPALATSLSELLKPEARFVCSVMARWCPFEIFWYLLHGRPSRAFRRLKRGWQEAKVSGLGASRVSVPVRYLSAANLLTALSPHFILIEIQSLGLLLPPPYMERVYRASESLWMFMRPLERRLRWRWPWRHMGDHLVLVFEKQ